ncbi:uncharacterized protein LOC100376615 [Saccoglossus kowalevskii]|uniref:Uncharacterized protein LOC100376615 n=1 Tax=Saccoglossus kowalevskii TaxID=10224 RepID=A0ABM0GLU2_SACKO|nr:PREDICTED: uncharacterized protein LOC100376615 [Saccoglossus kowalevskii]
MHVLGDIVLVLLMLLSLGSCILALVDGEDEPQCLVYNSPELDAKYCTDELRSFETRLTRILDKIEEKTEIFDFQRGCRRGWYGFSGHCYYFSRDKQTWNDARYWCETEGNSDLLSISGEGERDFVVDKLKHHEVDDDGAVHFWIGLNDKEVEGQYKWSSGVPLDRTYWKSDTNKYVLNAYSYVTVLQTLPDMYAITTCFWMKSSATNTGTPVSYATEQTDNEFIVYDYNSVKPFVVGQSAQSAVDLSDDLWHHACVTWTSINGQWQVYKDGVLAAEGTGLSTGLYIHGGGVLILGQEQDSPGGGFVDTQAFVGEFSLFNLWNRVLTSDEIGVNFADCIGTGNVYSWDSNAISAVSMTIVPFQSVCEQPNNYLEQDCVEIKNEFGSWNDANCNNQHRFICKTHKVPRDCMDVTNLGYKYSGVYSIDPDGHGSFDVNCDMETDGGGYTVFQRRTDGSVEFFRDWKDYKLGFGDLNDEFWLGNDKLNRLTRGRHQELRIDLTNVNGVTDFAVYDYFSISHENDFYRLRLGSKISGGLPDSLSHHLNMRFSTKDRDNTANNENCALNQHSGWWYNQCQYADLNREYADAFGISWYDWSNPRIIESIMKIR